MIHLRLATEAGIQEITPASLTHCAGCEREYYLDGPADPDPHFCCEVYDRRTDRRRLPECIRATNPVIVEERMDAMAAKEAPLWALMAPDDTWRLLGPNPSWNPQT